VKLLVYYHPESPTAPEIEALVRQVSADCAEQDIPLFLETLSYSLDPERKKLSPDERRYVVIETARRLTPLGGDVLKAEFPLDVQAVTAENTWQEACTELSQASRIPWVLLSASVDFETFLRQVTAACKAGASGVAVGRAVWREATEVPLESRQEFLDLTARERMRRITALVDALAKPWTDFYILPELTPEWFQ
jgi:tagatose-1,6-bisphosphate aldolase